MSEQLLIDGFEFSRTGRTLAGKIETAKLERLSGLLLDYSGVIEYSLSGETGTEGQPLLRIRVGGNAVLQCPVCLGKMDYPLVIESRLHLFRDENELGEIEDEDPEIDSIVAKDKLDVLSLVEDEILLDLPYSPRHAAGECEIEAGKRKESSFSALAVLKDKLSAD